MLLSSPRNSRNASVLIALCAICLHASDDTTQLDNYVIRAKQFVRTFYPSLDSKLHTVFHDTHELGTPGVIGPELMSNFTLELYYTKDTASPPACWCSAPVFQGFFAFDWTTDQKELFVMTASEPMLASRRDTFIQEMEKHPNWSDAEVAVA